MSNSVISSISKEASQRQSDLLLSVVTKPAHSFQGRREGELSKGRERESQARGVSLHAYLHALNAQYANSQIAGKQWKSTRRRFNDAATSGRQEKEWLEENLQGGTKSTETTLL